MKLFRRKVDGKEIGSLHVRVKNKPINLRTQNYETARKRAAEAKRGRRRFEDDNDGAADAIIAAVDGTGGAQDAARGRGGDGGAAGDTSPPEPPPPPPLPEPEPDALPVDAGNWAADIGAAAAAGSAGPGAAAGEESEVFDVADLDSMADTVAMAVIEGQIRAQAWLIKWAWKKYGDLPADAQLRCAEIPPDHPSRRKPTELLKKRLLTLVPQSLRIPTWAKWVEPFVVCAAHTAPLQAKTMQMGGDERPIPDAEAIGEKKAA